MPDTAFARRARCRLTRDNQANKARARVLVVLSVRTGHPQQCIRLEARFIPAPHLDRDDG